MDIILEVVKVICLFLMTWMIPVTIARAYYEIAIHPWLFIFQAIGITGFIYLQWLI